MICVNDVLIITGCIIKEIIETRSSLGDLWDYGSLFLGTGTLLVWIGMLRYLGFFHTYNILILTLKGALPNVLRFLLCASFIYIGFVLCGWLVLGPYNFKFKTILTTSECLFSLINGELLIMMTLKARQDRLFGLFSLFRRRHVCHVQLCAGQ